MGKFSTTDSEGRSNNSVSYFDQLVSLIKRVFFTKTKKVWSSKKEDWSWSIYFEVVFESVKHFFSYFSYFVLKRKAWLNFTLYRPLLKYSRPVRHDLKVDWSFLLNLNKKMNLNILPKLYEAFYKFLLPFISGKLWFSTQKRIFYYIASLIFRRIAFFKWYNKL